jgi:cholera toxin transcriptional activator
MAEGFRFGTFELDLKAGELRNRGIRLRLREQSLQILAMLLERPGEVVTRDELRERLWPDGTVVEFEHSVNTAVSRLRDALGDSASHPRFVETLPRRGYRFVAPVEPIEARAGNRTHLPLPAARAWAWRCWLCLPRQQPGR